MPLVYPPEVSENQMFSNVCKDYRKRPMALNGLGSPYNTCPSSPDYTQMVYCS